MFLDDVLFCTFVCLPQSQKRAAGARPGSSGSGSVRGSGGSSWSDFQDYFTLGSLLQVGGWVGEACDGGQSIPLCRVCGGGGRKWEEASRERELAVLRLPALLHT